MEVPFSSKTATILIYILAALAAGAALATRHADAGEKKEKIDALHLENKNYSLDCRDLTPGACKQLDETLRDINRYREEMHEYKELQKEMNQGLVPRKMLRSIANI